MEKASKWIRNFLLGKREEKDKKKVSSLSSLALAGEFAATPKEKRRWSFKKSASTDKIRHKSNRSFDEIYTARLVKQALQQQDIEQIRVKALLPANYNEANRTALVETSDSEAIITPRKDASVIKIQSVFRSYLARKALRALRALVKLQALVRGHLVRKQTTSVLRCMHALMTIQVRARVKRVQTTAEGDADQPSMKTTTIFQAEKVQQNQPSKLIYTNDMMNETIQERRRSTSKSKSGPLDHHPQVLHGFNKYHSGRLSISNQENHHHHQICSSPSEATNDQQTEEMPVKMKQKGLHRGRSIMSRTKGTKLPAASSFQHTMKYIGSPLLVPSYMSDTESSKAKNRSQSEPKRRPKRAAKQKSRRSTSMEGVNLVSDVLEKHMTSRHRQDDQENQFPWLFKLYRSAKPVKESDIDSASVTTYNSNYPISLTPFEPPVNLY